MCPATVPMHDSNPFGHQMQHGYTSSPPASPNQGSPLTSIFMPTAKRCLGYWPRKFSTPFAGPLLISFQSSSRRYALPDGYNTKNIHGILVIASLYCNLAQYYYPCPHPVCSRRALHFFFRSFLYSVDYRNWVCYLECLI